MLWVERSVFFVVVFGVVGSIFVILVEVVWFFGYSFAVDFCIGSLVVGFGWIC